MGQEGQIVPHIRQITPNNEKRKKYSDMAKQGVYSGSIQGFTKLKNGLHFLLRPPIQDVLTWLMSKVSSMGHIVAVEFLEIYAIARQDTMML